MSSLLAVNKDFPTSLWLFICCSPWNHYFWDYYASLHWLMISFLPLSQYVVFIQWLLCSLLPTVAPLWICCFQEIYAFSFSLCCSFNGLCCCDMENHGYLLVSPSNIYSHHGHYFSFILSMFFMFTYSVFSLIYHLVFHRQTSRLFD